MPKSIKDSGRAMKRSARRKIEVEEGSDNVFADIGLPNPDEALAKADVAREINRIITERGLTQLEAGRLLGIGQPRVSQLKRGRLGDFSLEKLIGFAKALGNQVEILIKPAPEPRIKVRVAAHRAGSAKRPSPANAAGTVRTARRSKPPLDSHAPRRSDRIRFRQRRATTVKAMRAADKRKGKRLKSAGALLKDLGI
jgi:predicted XRE-type DNA-binding protein